MALTTQQQYGTGNPIIHSHPSHWESGIDALDNPTFWQILCNLIKTWRYLYWYKTTYMQKQQEIDLREILDKATQGFIYMSLGTNVKSVMLSNETREEFLAAFSKLPYIVIWKFENEILSGRPDNVITMKWAPQQSILAHPNIKAFIYQVGLQSTEEAIFLTVPLIGLPVFSDQQTDVQKMVSLGVGKKLNIFNINRFDLVKAIQSVAGDGSYKQRLLKLRDLMEDKPYDSLENAVR
nr:UDP-glycosyltransferase UGT5-like [Neodiprion pinetum]